MKLKSYNSIFTPNAFQDQVIIITGGGLAIGRCTTHELASLRAQIIITGCKQDKLDQVIDEKLW